MSRHRMATSSSMELLDELLTLVNDVTAIGDEVKSQRENCWNLTRRIKLLAPLFEQIRKLKSPLPPAALMKFQETRTAFQKAKSLLEECKNGSRMYLVLERESMDAKFAELTSELARSLDGLPLNLLSVSEDIQEQIQLVHAQMKRAKINDDADEEQLHADIKTLLEEENEGNEDPALLDPIIGRLTLTSLPAIEVEIAALEKERVRLWETGAARSSAKELTQAIRLMRKLQISLGGEGVEKKEEEDDAGTSAAQINALNPPDEFRCPISLELMRDPVLVSTGQTYDRIYIEHWLKEGHKTCPKTQQVLSHQMLIPVYTLRSLIQQWCEANGVDLPKKVSRGGMQRQVSSGTGGSAEAGDRALILRMKERLASSDVNVQRAAAGDIRSLAKRSVGNRTCIGEAGVIPLLVTLLKTEDTQVQEHAVTALLNLSINDNNKGTIVAAGAIEPIVRVLRYGSTEGKENSAATLFSLSVIDENKISIGQSGAIPALVDLLMHGSARGKKDAATALFNLSIYQGNKGRAVRSGVIPPLMGLLKDRGAGMTDEALAILAILATSLEGRNAIGQAAAVPVLVDLLTSGSPRNKENAASVLYSLCVNGTEHTRDALKLQASIPLGQLLRHGTTRAKRKASQLLQHLQEQGDVQGFVVC